MNFPTPEIITISTLAEAADAGCDCVMLKFDGWPVLINCIGDGCVVYSAIKDGRPFLFRDLERQEELERCTTVESFNALLVGARSRTNPLIRIYDTWWMDGSNVTHLSYRERYVLTRMNAKKLDERFQMVTVLPIQAAAELWREVVKDPVQYKGLVFRHSKSAADAKVYTIRYYAEAPVELL